MTKKKETIINVALIAGLLVILYIMEQLMNPTDMIFTVLKKGAIYALVAVSMNLLNGFTGLFSLGQAGFMLLGAYTYGILTIPTEQRESVYQYFDGGIVQFAVPVAIGILAAGVVAAIFAYLIGLPVLRLKSDYLAIATLGFAEIIRAVFQWDKLGPLTNGSNLLRSYPTFKSVLFPFIVSGICIAVIVMLINSTYGRAFKAIRDDEIAAEAMGINLAHHKRIAFTVSSFFAGISGALLAMYQTTIQASMFKSAMTYEILLIVVIKMVISEPLQSLIDTVPMFHGLQKIGSGLIAIFIVYGCLYWVGMARIVRGQILQLKTLDFVTAAEALGCGKATMIKEHLLPNCIGQLIATVMLQIPSAIFTEAFLSYLGIGVSAPMASLGSLTSEALNGITTYPYRVIFPAVLISLIILSFNLFGDGLRDALDPKMKK